MKKTNQNKNVAFLLVIASVALLSACSGMNQNPLAGKGDAIENAQPPSTKPEIPEPVQSDALRIDGPTVLSFREGEQAKASFSLRSLLPDYTGQIVVTNLQTFPGATFDAKTGEFTWTPALGTVFTGYYQEMVLNLQGVAETAKSTDPVLLANKEVRVLVQKVTRNPMIRSIETVEMNIRENKMYYVTLYIQDPDFTGVDADRPRLILNTNKSSKVAVTPFMSEFGFKADSATREWAITIKIDLTNAEITNSVAQTIAEFTAVNRYGMLSAPASLNLNVFTDLNNNFDSTIETTNDVVVGEKNVIPFTIFDPKGEAVLTLKKTTGLPATAELKCAWPKNSMYKCKLTWTPDQKDLLKVYTIKMDVEISNKNNVDTLKVNKSLSFNLSTVASAAMPLPNPGLPVDGGNN